MSSIGRIRWPKSWMIAIPGPFFRDHINPFGPFFKDRPRESKYAEGLLRSLHGLLRVARRQRIRGGGPGAPRCDREGAEACRGDGRPRGRDPGSLPGANRPVNPGKRGRQLEAGSNLPPRRRRDRLGPRQGGEGETALL